jgi:hypothetical protein
MLERLCDALAMKDKKKRPRDISQLAASIVAETTGEMKAEEIPSDKNPHAVALGRLGGLKGGSQLVTT